MSGAKSILYMYDDNNTVRKLLTFDDTNGIHMNCPSTQTKFTVEGKCAITGDLAVDTNTLKVDSTNNRVGIVKTSPAYPLDVVGNVNVSTGSTYKVNGNDVLSGTTLGSGVTSSSLTSVGTLSSLSVTGDLTVDTDTLKVDTTNNRVGIKNASPAYTLDVSGDCNLSEGSKYRINGVEISTGGGSPTYYGAFYDTTTQTNENEEETGFNYVNCNSTYTSSGVSVSTDTFTVTNAGTYKISVQIQIFTEGASFWLEKNSSQVTNSKRYCNTSGIQTLESLTFVHTFAANDTFKIAWYADPLASSSLVYSAADSEGAWPATPSVNVFVSTI